MSIWAEEHEHMLIRFWIRDGEREYEQFVICHKNDFPSLHLGSANEEQLIKMYISDDITEDEEDERTYWVHNMEALCKVEKCFPISRETKELLNRFGVY